MEGMLGRGIAVLIAISFVLSLMFGFLAELVTNSCAKLVGGGDDADKE